MVSTYSIFAHDFVTNKKLIYPNICWFFPAKWSGCHLLVQGVFPFACSKAQKSKLSPNKIKKQRQICSTEFIIPFCPLFHTFNFPFLWSVEIMLKSAPILSFTSQHTAYGAKSFEILLTFFQGRNYGYSKNVEPCCHLKVWFISAMLQYNVLKWKLAHKS